MAFQRKKAAGIGVKAPLPGFIEPALATSIERVPSGRRWIHEIKFDGYYGDKPDFSVAMGTLNTLADHLKKVPA